MARLEQPKGGFNFDNYQRNLLLEEKGFPLPKATKTGTTIVGIVYKNGVCLGADTRATSDTTVVEKNCFKIHYLAPNIRCGGAGTAADTEFSTALINSQLELHRLATGRQTRVVTAMMLLKQMLYKYHGYIGAALIIGGYDIEGPRLYTVSPHGNSDYLPFVTMGSGCLAAMAVLETRWREDLEREEAMELVKDAIEAGIFNDLGSGSNVDLTLIEKDKVDLYRNYIKPNERPPKEQSYKMKPGTTGILKESIRDLVTVIEGVEDMDIS